MTDIHDRAERRGRYIFSLILVLLAVGIVAGGSYFYRNIKRNSRAEVERQLNAVADLKVNELARYRQDRLADGAVFYKNAPFSALVRRHFEHPNDLEARDQLRAWLGHIQAAAAYERVMLLDPQYSKKMIVPEGPERSTSFVSPASSEGLRSGKIVFEDFYWNDANQRIYLKILVPILDEAPNDRVIGILALRIDPETYLYPYINRWPTPSRTAETQIIRRDGNDVLYLNELKFQKDTALHLRIPLGSKDATAVKAVLGQEGIVEGVDYRGVPVVAALRPIPDSPWFLVAKIDASEAFGPMRARLWEIVIMVAILLLGTAEAVGYFWRRQRAIFYQGRYQATEALRESEERFRVLFESSHDAIMTVEPPSWNFTSANPATVAMFRAKDAQELVSYGPGNLSPERQPDGRSSAEKSMEMIETAMREGSGLFEWTHARTDRTEFPATVLLTRMEHAGKVILQATVRDITEQKRAEEALKESERKFRTIFDKANDGMFLVDLETRKFLMCNARCLQMLGYTQEEFLTLEISDIHPKDDVPIIFGELAKFMKGEGGVRHDLRFRRKDGSLFFSDLSPSLVTLAGKKSILIVYNNITERKKLEEEKRQANEKLSSMVEKLKERDLQNSVLSEMREFLQASSTMEEIGPVILRSMNKLFPDSEGALFLLSPSKTDLESAVRWGDFPEDVADNAFSPDACWGLRRGSAYVVEDIKSGLICPHLKHHPATAYACLPLMAKGDVLGLLHVRGRSTGTAEDALRLISDLKDLTSTLSELLSLSISNIKLREILSVQSIKDPLTGLFNRRYMEENFQREISRAARKQDQIGVIMADIDHFKDFNDLYGHAAGDVVLVELANFFKLRTRGTDIACRYGGEEFAFILPESSLENAVKRASQMIEEARTLRVQYAGQTLGPTTLSMGVAAYPIHGTRPEDLLRAADAALYRAKKEGRDRIITA